MSRRESEIHEDKRANTDSQGLASVKEGEGRRPTGLSSCSKDITMCQVVKLVSAPPSKTHGKEKGQVSWQGTEGRKGLSLTDRSQLVQENLEAISRHQGLISRG